MNLINEEIRKLVEDIRVGCGEMEGRKFTEDYEDNMKNDKKVKVVNPRNMTVEPGARVEIYWRQFQEPDHGYIFTLPGFDEDDIFMSGIVHIPLPQGGDKSQDSAEWIYLPRLLSYPEVFKVKIIGEKK